MDSHIKEALKFHTLDPKKIQSCRFYNIIETNVQGQIISDFEGAIDDLRRGNIKGYSDYAKNAGIALISSENEDFELPQLGNYFSEEDLKAYEDLAEAESKVRGRK